MTKLGVHHGPTMHRGELRCRRCGTPMARKRRGLWCNACRYLWMSAEDDVLPSYASTQIGS